MEVKLTMTLECRGCKEEYDADSDNHERMEIDLDLDLLKAAAAGPATLADEIHKRVERYVHENDAWGWTTDRAGNVYCPFHSEDIINSFEEQVEQEELAKKAGKAFQPRKERKPLRKRHDNWRITIDKDQ